MVAKNEDESLKIFSLNGNIPLAKKGRSSFWHRIRQVLD